MKTHSSTAFAIVVDISGLPRNGTFYLADAKSPKELEDRQRRLANEFEQLIERHIEPHFGGDFTVLQSVQREFTCSACGAAWTEKSETYNGGCCAEDEKHNPEIAADAAPQPATSGA